MAARGYRRVVTTTGRTRMEQTQLSLWDAVNMVADGQIPTPDDPCFQSFALRMVQAQERNLVADFQFIQDRSRRSGRHFRALLAGRITGEGLDYVSLTQTSPSCSSLRLEVDRFIQSRMDSWRQRLDDRKMNAKNALVQQHGPLAINSSGYPQSLAKVYADEVIERIEDIRRRIAEYLDQTSTPVDGEDAVDVLRDFARSIGPQLRHHFLQLANERGLMRSPESFFEVSDRKIRDHIDQISVAVQSYAVAAAATKAKEASLTGIAAASQANPHAKTTRQRLWLWIGRGSKWTIITIMAAIIGLVVVLFGTRMLEPLVDRLFESKTSDEVGGAEAPPSLSPNDE